MYYLRSAGGSWIGVEGRDANWDGIFLDAGLRDVSVMGQTGSSYWGYHKDWLKGSYTLVSGGVPRTSTSGLLNAGYGLWHSDIWFDNANNTQVGSRAGTIIEFIGGQLQIYLLLV